MNTNSDSIGHLLNNAARLAKKDFASRMQKVGITFPQFMVIKDIYTQEEKGSKNQNLTLAAIAERVNSNRPNMTGVIERLEKQGLINRSINPKDRRSQIITLTDKAKDVMERLQRMSKETTNKALESFSEDEAKIIKECLIRIINNLQ